MLVDPFCGPGTPLLQRLPTCPVRTRTYVPVVSTRLLPRLQGDIGELSALAWLADQGADVFVPIGHSRDVDLIAIFGEQLLRVQVKTSTVVLSNRRYEVTLATRGGNRSWNGLVKRFSSKRCDYLFAHVGDGRRWSSRQAPSTAAAESSWAGRNTLRLGWTAAVRWPPSRTIVALDWPAPAGFPSGQRDQTVNLTAQPSQVRILPPP